MESKNKNLLKNFGILTLSNFATKILVFLLVPIYTSALSLEEFGIYDFVTTTFSLFIPIVTLNIIDGVMRFLLDKNSMPSEIAIIGIKFNLLGVFVVAVALLVIYFLSLFPILSDLLSYIFILYILTAFNQFFIQFAKGLNKVIYMGVAGVINAALTLVFNILFLVVFEFGLDGFFLAFIISLFVTDLYFFISLRFWRYCTSININKSLQKKMIVYSVPLILTCIGWWVNSGADRYVVSIYCGIAANGLLAAAYKIPSILNVFQAIFIQAWQITAVKEYESNDKQKYYANTFNFINVCMCTICSIIILCVPYISYILFSNEFYTAWQFVPFLLICCVINSAAGFIGPILSANMNSKGMALSALYGSIANLSLNIILVVPLGIQGVTIASAIASFIIFVVRYRYAKTDMPLSNLSSVFLIWGLLCVQAVICCYFEIFSLELPVFIAILFLNRSYIMLSFSKLSSYIKRKHN